MFDRVWETYATTALDADTSVVSISSDSSISNPDNIFDAAAKGNQEALKLFLVDDPSLVMKICPFRKRTPLYLASQRGHSECVQILMDHGAKDVDGDCYLAAKNESTKQVIFWHELKKKPKNVVMIQPSPQTEMFPRFYCCGAIGS